MSLVDKPFTVVNPTEFDGKLIIPLDTVKPLLHVNKFVDIIEEDVKVPELEIEEDVKLLVVKAPLFVIDPDVIKEELFILILLILSVVFRVFKYDEPETFNDKVFTLSD